MVATRSNWAVVEMDYTHNIFYIEDITNKTGGMSITNDAEAVYQYIDENFSHAAPTPKRWRVVYKDTNNEWWEMIPEAQHDWDDIEYIRFERWNGLAWDILKRNTNE